MKNKLFDWFKIIIGVYVIGLPFYCCNNFKNKQKTFDIFSSVKTAMFLIVSKLAPI